MGAEVDENTSVRLGRLSGIDYLISCNLIYESSLSNRLNIRIVDIETAEVIGVGSDLISVGLTISDSIPIRYFFKDRNEILISDQWSISITTKELSRKILNTLRVAVVNIESKYQRDQDLIPQIIEEELISDGFRVVDRSRLDLIRDEHQFQMGNIMDDDSLVRFGKFSGADVIITARIDSQDTLITKGFSYGDRYLEIEKDYLNFDLRRLKIKAIKVETGEIISVASEHW